MPAAPSAKSPCPADAGLPAPADWPGTAEMRRGVIGQGSWPGAGCERRRHLCGRCPAAADNSSRVRDRREPPRASTTPRANQQRIFPVALEQGNVASPAAWCLRRANTVTGQRDVRSRERDRPAAGRPVGTSTRRARHAGSALPCANVVPCGIEPAKETPVRCPDPSRVMVNSGSPKPSVHQTAPGSGTGAHGPPP